MKISRSIKAGTAAGVYIAAILAANWLTNRYGFVSVVGVGMTAGTIAAGVALGARDALQDTAGRLAVLAAILVGAALSWWLSTPVLALASGAAFLVSEAADMAVYTPLRRRGWARAVVASNVVGGIVDTLVFLTLAGFPVTTQTVGGQLVGKLVFATLIPVLVILAIRAAVTARQPETAEVAA